MKGQLRYEMIASAITEGPVLILKLWLQYKCSNVMVATLC